ncbi:hypothetical protein [Chamaesiphon sp. VAR_48_metabat_135_sub]|uniref:hypothetical protein n=1 Tax=Chamaesiphon sp. VAR_48_metabat_135_sub TaxID=2964699 RepID=UPI00286AC2D3|nr:hypothetical protein [Chamaesiphon sp. VAR_48_metabat_135_sub]
MKISSYLLGLGAVASLVALNLNPANAQLGNGSDNGNTFTSVTSVGGGGVIGGGEPTYASQSQTAVNQLSQSLTANTVGDAATFDVVNGAEPAPLVAGLLPAGVAPDGPTGKAATVLATTVKGMRSGNGNINATKLNASVGAYNEYVKAMVGELGPEKAVTSAPSGQKALQGLLGQLIQTANSATPTVAPTPSAAPAPDAAPAPVAPPAPGAPPAPEVTPPPAPKQ